MGKEEYIKMINLASEYAEHFSDSEFQNNFEAYVILYKASYEKYKEYYNSHANVNVKFFTPEEENKYYPGKYNMRLGYPIGKVNKEKSNNVDDTSKKFFGVLGHIAKTTTAKKTNEHIDCKEFNEMIDHIKNIYTKNK